MAIFPTTIKPSFTFQKTEKPKVRVTKLGDGFEQRVVFGLPTQLDPNVFDVNFNKNKIMNCVKRIEENPVYNGSNKYFKTDTAKNIIDKLIHV